MEQTFVRVLGAALVQKRSFELAKLMDCSEQERIGLLSQNESQFRTLHLLDLLPIFRWPGAHTVSRFHHSLDLEAGNLKVQVDVKRKPDIVPGSTVTDYFLAYTFPVQMVEVPGSGKQANQPLSRELRIIPSRGIEQHKERLWDPEEFLNTVPQEDRQHMERLFDQYGSGPEGFLASHSRDFR